jgi:hypothetical protein
MALSVPTKAKIKELFHNVGIQKICSAKISKCKLSPETEFTKKQFKINQIFKQIVEIGQFILKFQTLLES